MRFAEGHGLGSDSLVMEEDDIDFPLAPTAIRWIGPETTAHPFRGSYAHPGWVMRIISLRNASAILAAACTAVRVACVT